MSKITDPIDRSVVLAAEQRDPEEAIKELHAAIMAVNASSGERELLKGWPMTLQRISITDLEPHPQNPRYFPRENVIAAIEAQLKERGYFEERHALTVRKLGSKYQIISGHQRFEAAKRAGLDEIPCHVVEMSDEEALDELLFSNAQSDLVPLEKGTHILMLVGKSKGGRSKKSGIREYARKMGATQQTMSDWVCAAEVAKVTDWSVTLLEYTTSLSVIHRTPEEDWPDLVKRMLAGSWTKEMTERFVEVIKSLQVPDDLAAIFPRPVLLARFFKSLEFSQQSLAAVIRQIRITEEEIRAHDGTIDAASQLATFHAWLAANAQECLDKREIEKWRRAWFLELDRLEAEQQKSQQWLQGDWRQHVEELADGSIALLLTDPPYGIDYQSRRAVAGKATPRIENDGRDEAPAEVAACFTALFPKLKAEAHVLCFCHWQRESDFKAALEVSGYEIRSSVVWVKDQHGSGDLNGTFAPKYEHILYAVKGSPDLFHRDPDVIECPRVTKSEHPAEKPVALLERLIEATTVAGELVADPFGGVASTLVAAKGLKRTYWGCELDAKYFEAGQSRLRATAEKAL